MGDLLYAGRDPLDRFYTGEPFRLKKVNGAYQLQIKMPFISREDIDLNVLPEELIVKIGTYKRHIPLPRPVAASKSVKAKLEGDTLNITLKGV